MRAGGVTRELVLDHANRGGGDKWRSSTEIILLWSSLAYLGRLLMLFHTAVHLTAQMLCPSIPLHFPSAYICHGIGYPTLSQLAQPAHAILCPT